MTITFEALAGIGEITSGDDLGAIITKATDLRDRDVVVVTSKVVSKAAGLTTSRPKSEVLEEQTDRVVARRGETRIVRTHHGLTMAAAGIDNSNTSPGTLIPLPPDPDSSARQIRQRIHEITRLSVAVVITDTAGRAWRVGQTDIAIGCAGIIPFVSFAGRTDPYGNQLAVTTPAVADEIAGAAELASGKFGGRPVVVVRGADPAWLTDEDGPGAGALIRAEDGDMFGLGAREAALAAILGSSPVRGLATDEDMTLDILAKMALEGLTFDSDDVSIAGDLAEVTVNEGAEVSAGVLAQRLVSLGVAHGMTVRVSLKADETG